MLDHQDRAAGRNLLDQLGHAIHVLMAHALRRLIEQHQFRLHREGGRDLERTLAAVRQVDSDGLGELGQPDLFEQIHRAGI
ncbi:hypothetical protein D3C79_1084570 [compost metagenome]